MSGDQAEQVVPLLGGTETILVVEPEVNVRLVTQKMLERGGYSVIMASDGITALRLAQEHPGPIQLLLSEIVIAGMSLIDLAHSLGQLHPRIRLLCLSGHPECGAPGRLALPQGAAFLPKPFTLDTLSRMVREVLDRD